MNCDYLHTRNFNDSIPHTIYYDFSIPRTRKLLLIMQKHIHKTVLSTRVYSLSTCSKEERISVLEIELSVEEISGFVVCMYEEKWWVTCVIDVDEDDNAVKVNFLHPQGPLRS